MNSEHTPGPWRTGAGNFGLIKAGREVIAETRGNNLAPGVELANAKLLAAAPDLKDALVRIARGDNDPQNIAQNTLIDAEGVVE